MRKIQYVERPSEASNPVLPQFTGVFILLICYIQTIHFESTIGSGILEGSLPPLV